MNIKIYIHLMPWELDDAFIIFNKIGLANKYLNPNDKLYVDTCLNLSSYIINWSKSTLTKEFFIDKYNYILNALYNVNHNSKIEETSELYGHLDFQKEIIDPKINFYLPICSDVYFHHHAIILLIESAKLIKDDYFLITPETPKLWDNTWDILTNNNFKNDLYNNWNDRDIYDIIYKSENIQSEPYLEKINSFKYAGWIDLYNKNFYEKLVPCFDDWHGYGPWDTFGTNIAYIAKHKFNLNVNQYVLRNQIIFDKDIGIFQSKKTPNVYKKFLNLNEIPDQRQLFESNTNNYINQWLSYAKTNKII